MSGTMVLGIGNQMNGDDAAGIYVVDIINHRRRTAKDALPNEIVAIDTGTTPESYTSVIRRYRPDLLILVDAADMGLLPGSLRIITPEKINILSFSTHHIPVPMFISYVKGLCGKILLIGVQPEETKTGTVISKVVRTSMRKLAEAILEGHVGEIPLLV